jgi:hypothetical protein
MTSTLPRLSAANDQFGEDLPVRVPEMFAEKELESGLTDGHGRATELLVLAQEQEVLAELILAERGRVTLKMIGQPPHVTDIFLFGRTFEVFEFDKLLESCDGRVISIHEDRGCPQQP